MQRGFNGDGCEDENVVERRGVPPFRECDDRREHVWRGVMCKRTTSSCEALGRSARPKRELAIHHELDDELGDDRDVGVDALGLHVPKRHGRSKSSRTLSVVVRRLRAVLKKLWRDLCETRDHGLVGRRPQQKDKGDSPTNRRTIFPSLVKQSGRRTRWMIRWA